MARLRQSDLQRALDLIGACEDAVDLDSFGRSVLGVAGLVPGVVAFNEIDLARGTATAVKDVPDPPGLDTVAEFARLAHQNPLVVHGRPDDPPQTISDLLSARSFRALELYEAIFAPYGFKDQIAVHLSAPTHRVAGIAINRERRGFSERDRELLALLGPHLSRAYAHVLERQRSRALQALLERGLEQTGTAAIVLDPDGRLERVDERAEAMLRSFCDPPAPGRLPLAISEWQTGEAPRPELVIDGGEGRRLIARLVELDVDPGWQAILLDEWLPGPSPAELRPLGLTPREAEVLAWVARGRSDGEIGALLAISPRTVDKHLENTFRKLGVRSRAEAVARALGRST
jgi:DNA-binding CsgD family transcriptional regulator